jgi:hypothetical protein
LEPLSRLGATSWQAYKPTHQQVDKSTSQQANKSTNQQIDESQAFKRRQKAIETFSG